MTKVTVIGLGYVGLGIAINASRHFKVLGFDLDTQKINSLNLGKSYIEDVKNELLVSAINSGQFSATANQDMIKGSEIIVICVPTPLDENRLPDLSMVVRAAKIIAENVKTPALIINESTSYPGTLRNIIKETIQLTSKIEHEYASSPERVDPGNSIWNLKNTPRLVSGLTPDATKRALDFYATFADNLVEVSSPEVAETAKLFENTFRQVNIALVNELAMICDSLKINVFDVINAANTKPYGFMKFNPGPGVGGHCIPVDPTYLAYIAENAGVKARFIDLANQVNLDMPIYIIDRCEKLVGNLASKKILIAGVSYKADIADVRETPAELIRNEALARGAEVSWFDPIVENWEPGKVLNLEKNSYDLVIFQTVHSTMNVEDIRKCAKFAFDCTGKVAGVESL